MRQGQHKDKGSIGAEGIKQHMDKGQRMHHRGIRTGTRERLGQQGRQGQHRRRRNGGSARTGDSACIREA